MSAVRWYLYDNVPGHELGNRAIVDAEGATVCNPSPMGEANARLIAAAPELLETVRDLIACANPARDQVELKAARALLRRIEGRAPDAITDYYANNARSQRRIARESGQ